MKKIILLIIFLALKSLLNSSEINNKILIGEFPGEFPDNIENPQLVLKTELIWENESWVYYSFSHRYMYERDEFGNILAMYYQYFSTDDSLFSVGTKHECSYGTYIKLEDDNIDDRETYLYHVDGEIRSHENWRYDDMGSWGIETSGQSTSQGGIGMTTVEMKSDTLYLDADWDFVDETVNGTDDNWKMISYYNDGYPYLTWQIFQMNGPGNVVIAPSGSDMSITWDVAPNVDTYSVYSSDNPYAEFPIGWFQEVSGLTDPNWIDTNTTNTKKFYIVVGMNGEKE